MRHQLTRVLPYTPEQLFELVGDVARYPEFVPHLKSIRVWDQRSDGTGLSSLKAEAAVGFTLFQERVATAVRRDRERLVIEVDLLHGPFRHLTNRWRFAPLRAGTEVDFFIDFAFRSRLLEAVLAANLERAVERIILAFDDRARQLYGPRT